MVDWPTIEVVIGVVGAFGAVVALALGWLIDRLRDDVRNLTRLPERVAYLEGRVDTIVGVVPHRADFIKRVEELGAKEGKGP